MRDLLGAVRLGVVVAAVGCGPPERNLPTTGSDASGSIDAAIDGTSVTTDGSPGNPSCNEAAELVYVLDQNRQLSTFDPATKTFASIGTLNCPSQGVAQPHSMAVDRTPTAWVLYNNGALFRVDTTTAQCTSASPGVGMTQFGMGFSTDVAGGTEETLFIAGSDVVTPIQMATLATLDTATMALGTLGMVQGLPELTGTGDAELWGWFPDAFAPRVERLDKTTGAALETFELPSLKGLPRAWAFAFWGGDFWVFLKKDAELSTTVYQIDGTTGAIEGSTPTTSRSIVGAGVSTCAPIIIY